MNKRQARGMNKKFSDIDADSTHNDAIARSMHQKRKISASLGSQWSKKELKHFYEAYRKYGKNWKKVAGFVRSRSEEMVEALYKMNRAYLSLPEGAATVVGLIAMVTDHCNILDGSEMENNDVSGFLQKPQMCSIVFQPNISRGLPAHSPDLLQSRSAASSRGGLSLLNKGQFDGSIPRRRRTLRFPVSYPHEKGDMEKCASPNQQDLKCEVNANVGEIVHGATSTLPESLLKEGSLGVSQTDMISSSCRNDEEKHPEPEMVSAKLIGIAMEDCSEGPSERQGNKYGDFTRETSDMMVIDSISSLDIHKKMKRFQGKKPKVQNTENNHFGDFKRTCSGSEELNLVNENNETEFTLKKVEQSADSFVQLKGEKRIFDKVGNANIDEPEVMSANSGVSKPKSSDAKEKGHEAVSIHNISVLAAAKLGMGMTLDVSVSEVKHQLHLSTRKMRKRKHDILASEIPKIESATDSLRNKRQKTEIPTIESVTDSLPNKLQKTEIPLIESVTDSLPNKLQKTEILMMEAASDSLPNKFQKTENSSALLNSRQCNTYHENSPSCCLKPVASSISPAAPLNVFDCSVSLTQESGFNGVVVFERSQLKAWRMVDVAVQVASSLKKGEDTFTKIGEALESSNNQNFSADCGTLATRSSMASDVSSHNLAHWYQATSCTSVPTIIVDANGLDPCDASEQIEMPIPSALISSCVATLLMIQTCTDRQHPPAEVAQILESATIRLRPFCSQNLAIYREIQMCMGMVKNQILALTPT